jgi:hypothetical protein
LSQQLFQRLLLLLLLMMMMLVVLLVLALVLPPLNHCWPELLVQEVQEGVVQEGVVQLFGAC